ncbi:MAG: DUF4416 family protein [Candidatus Marinimicrobia bacterium]|nr:DUF4416 family protein [Candidatus Neomarinimicrobiota bacterium]
MSKIKPVKLIIGLLYSNRFNRYDEFMYKISNIFDKIDSTSNLFSFTYTDYYEKELGNNLSRQFISFEKMIFPENISEIKIITNIIEKQYSNDNNRMINIDPGYLDLDKFVMASVKYGRQKTYIGDGIYADTVLEYYKKRFHFFNWSFPDFQTDKYYSYLSNVRNIYKKQLNTKIEKNIE